jgi:hypothetical protein
MFESKWPHAIQQGATSVSLPTMLFIIEFNDIQRDLKSDLELQARLMDLQLKIDYYVRIFIAY